MCINNTCYGYIQHKEDISSLVSLNDTKVNYFSLVIKSNDNNKEIIN